MSFFGSVKSFRRSVFSYCLRLYAGFGPKSRGADGEPTTTFRFLYLRTSSGTQCCGTRQERSADWG
jgi:hypothetical protein